MHGNALNVKCTIVFASGGGEAFQISTTDLN